MILLTGEEQQREDGAGHLDEHGGPAPGAGHRADGQASGRRTKTNRLGQHQAAGPARLDSEGQEKLVRSEIRQLVSRTLAARRVGQQRHEWRRLPLAALVPIQHPAAPALIGGQVALGLAGRVGGGDLQGYLIVRLKRAGAIEVDLLCQSQLQMAEPVAGGPEAVQRLPGRAVAARREQEQQQSQHAHQQRPAQRERQQPTGWRVAGGEWREKMIFHTTRHPEQPTQLAGRREPIVQGEACESAGEVGQEQAAELGSCSQHAAQADLHQPQPLQPPEIAGTAQAETP